MDLQLKDKIIIVTGGAKGIGAGIVKVLAAEGAIPVVVGRNADDNEAMLKEIGGKGFAVAAELTDPNECKKAVDETIKKFGRIDGVVNNAGVNDGVGIETGTMKNSLHHCIKTWCIIILSFIMHCLN
jgi:NAD(P)-dependent dehydrogenase (short-subunit alcohol dehydrogenase family)